MPDFGGYDYAPDWRRLAAWRAHYQAKGCSALKSSALAHKKLRRSTWPPA